MFPTFTTTHNCFVSVLTIDNSCGVRHTKCIYLASLTATPSHLQQPILLVATTGEALTSHFCSNSKAKQLHSSNYHEADSIDWHLRNENEKQMKPPSDHPPRKPSLFCLHMGCFLERNGTEHPSRIKTAITNIVNGSCHRAAPSNNFYTKHRWWFWPTDQNWIKLVAQHIFVFACFFSNFRPESAVAKWSSKFGHVSQRVRGKSNTVGHFESHSGDVSFYSLIYNSYYKVLFWPRDIGEEQGYARS